MQRALNEGTLGSFSDLLLILHNFEHSVVVPNGATIQTAVYLLYLALLGSRTEYEHSQSTTYGYALKHLDGISGQPLSLSLYHGSLSKERRSWNPSVAKYRTRLLLIHPTSNFSVSRDLRPETGPLGPKNKVEREPHEQVFRGFTVDVILRRSEEAMPPRRHCDHYTVADNAFFFTEWFEFAKKHSRKRELNDLILEFTDTIQARGCGHIWEDPDSTAETRIEQAKDFFRFLEDPDAVVTNKIRIFYAACFASHERRFALTRKGRFCLVPAATEERDLICVPHHSRVPYIFRQMRANKTLNNIGEAYVYGIMQGEGYAVDIRNEQEFVLV